MDIRDEELDAGLGEAFRGGPEGSVLGAIERLHGVGSSILLREDTDDSPILIRRDDEEAPTGDRRYQVLGEIARGGIGVIYQGHDVDLNRPIALKVLRMEYADREDVVQRFVEEAQVGGQLQHPGIVPVYGIGLQADGRPSFAMKLIRGQTLAELLATDPGVGDLISVFEQMTLTMAYAHSRGVIHRDLKPANVMIGAFGEVQVVDWGFAKVLGQTGAAQRPLETIITTARGTGDEERGRSIQGEVLGTPAYMPPEQARGRIDELDERTDVFALGAILLEILTGSAPYTGPTKEQLVAAMQCRQEPAHARLDAAPAAEELKQIVRDCLKPRSEERPANARVLANRLSAYLAHVEERAKQSELDALAAEAETLRERQGRRRALVLGAVVLLAIVGAAAAFVLWGREREVRLARATPGIAAAMREATALEGRREWTSALAAAQRAVDIARSEGVDDAGAGTLLTRLEAERVRAEETARIEAEDLALLSELEEIRGRHGQLVEVDASALVPAAELLAMWGDGKDEDHAPRAGARRRFTVTTIGDAETDQAYATAFGRRFETLESAGERLAASAHAESFAATLGFWSWLRKTKLASSNWQGIDRLARRISSGHADVRDALIGGDLDALVAMAEGGGEDLPPALAAHVAFALVENDRAAAAVDFLEARARRTPNDFWIRLRLAAAAHALGDEARAARHATASLAIRPGHPAALWLLTVALESLGDEAGAVATARRVAELAPDDAYVLRFFGGRLSNASRFDEAIRVLQRSIEIDPTAATSHIFLANTLFKRGDRGGAIAGYRRALELDPDNRASHIGLGTALTQAGAFEEAIALFRRAAELDPESGWPDLLLGWALERSGHVAESLVAYRRAATIEPTLSQHLGAALSRRGDLDGAISALRRAVEISPGNADALEALGGVLMKKGDTEAAFEASRRAAQLDPTRWYSHLSIANECFRRGDHAGALDASRRAVESGPDQWSTHASRAMILSTTGHLDAAIRANQRAIELGGPVELMAKILGTERDLDGSIAAYRRATQLVPGQALFHGALARCLFQGGDLDNAFSAARRAIELDDASATGHAYVGRVLRARGEGDAALAALRRAAELAPPEADFVTILGQEMGMAGDIDGAVRVLRRAVEIEPDNLSALRNLGYALRKQGELEEALTTLRRAQELRPEDPWTRARIAEIVAELPLVAALERVLAGEDPELAPTQRAHLALMLYHEQRFAQSAEMYARAFAEDPALETDLGAGHCYWAACSAALAGGAWNARSIHWLRADLARWSSRLEEFGPDVIVARMTHWQADGDLVSVRDSDDRPRDARKLWVDVDALLRRAKGMK